MAISVVNLIPDDPARYRVVIPKELVVLAGAEEDYELVSVEFDTWAAAAEEI